METTTSQKIDKALETLKAQNWWYCFADYTHPAYDNAYSNMRAFVELVATINDKAIVKALRELWTATYENVHANMFSRNDEATATFKAKETELMAIIRPQYAQAA